MPLKLEWEDDKKKAILVPKDFASLDISHTWNIYELPTTFLDTILPPVVQHIHMSLSHGMLLQTACTLAWGLLPQISSLTSVKSTKRPHRHHYTTQTMPYWTALELHAGFTQCNKAERDTHWANHRGSASIVKKSRATEERQGGESRLLVVGWVEASGKRLGITHLIRIMFQGAVVTHVSHSIQICVPLVNIVHIGAVVFLI